MKASTALSKKMILNMITTGAMTRLGYVYDNLMVNVHMKNAKLVERGINVLMKVCNIDRETAIRTIKSAGKSIPIAVVRLKANVDKMEAVRRLQQSDGNVRLAIDDSRLSTRASYAARMRATIQPRWLRALLLLAAAAAVILWLLPLFSPHSVLFRPGPSFADITVYHGRFTVYHTTKFFTSRAFSGFVYPPGAAPI